MSNAKMIFPGDTEPGIEDICLETGNGGAI
jgi:hypothetical protein